jgi:RHS repeat-associated protein
MGTDILGSVRSVTGDDGGSSSERYEYDIFGTPYKGEFGEGMNLGYTGKPYDMATGMYNYGYRDYAPQVARFTTVDPVRDGNNWFAYVNNDPVNFVDLKGLAPRNMSEEDRDAYKDAVGAYADYNNKTNTMGVPNEYDCADVATYLYGEGMAAAGKPNATSNLQHSGENITSIPQIQSTDFFGGNTNNITYYEDKSFNNPNVETGTVAVWAGPGATGNGSIVEGAWVGHVATVVSVTRDENGNVTSITTIEGHVSNPTAIERNDQDAWDSYLGTFLGFGEIGSNSTTSPTTGSRIGSKGH